MDPFDSPAFDRIPPVINGYRLLCEIGNGAAGTVRIAKRKKSGSDEAKEEKCCCKIIQKSSLLSENERNFFQSEVDALSMIVHPNIASFIELCEDDDNYYIFQEYCKGISLLDYINQKNKLSEGEAAKLFIQLIQALNYLHSMNIAHRDIKLDNIMLVVDDNLDSLKISHSCCNFGSCHNNESNKNLSRSLNFEVEYNIKLIDFGLCTLHSDKLRETFCGSPLYAAPECLCNQPYDATKSDIWSAGVVFYIMVTGCFPWDPTNLSRMVNCIVSNDYSIPSSVSARCSQLIQKMMNPDPNQRPTAIQLLNDSDLLLLMPVRPNGRFLPRTKNSSMANLARPKLPNEKSSHNPHNNNIQNANARKKKSIESPSSNDKKCIPLPTGRTLKVRPPKQMRKSLSFFNAPSPRRYQSPK